MHLHHAFFAPRTSHASPHIYPCPLRLQTQADITWTSLQFTQCRSCVATTIIKATKKGNALANYGVEHTIAVSTACGMLNHLIVQTTMGTQKCLEFSRKYNMDRASFDPLNKMTSWPTCWQTWKYGRRPSGCSCGCQQ